jgi:hypothetical protein
MKSKARSNIHRGRRRRARPPVKGGPTRLISQAPSSEAQTDSGAAASLSSSPEGNGAGILRVESEQSRAAEDLIEGDGTDRLGLLPGRFVLTILALAIIFIAIITWFISQMPEKSD